MLVLKFLLFVEYMGKKDIQFNLRIPEELKNKVDAAAKANQRSINAEATSRLYDSFVMNDNIQVEAAKIVENAKCSRPSVCNAMETLLVNDAVAAEFLPQSQTVFAYW